MDSEMARQASDAAHENQADNQADNESEAARAEEIRSAKEVVQFLAKTARTLKIYSPNNPVHQKFLSELREKFDAHLSVYDRLTLQVRQFQFVCGQEVAYENSNRSESLAFRLYIDGIREISFHEGIEFEEIVDFLEALGKDSGQGQSDDDLATLLWEKGFAHISYQVAEEELPAQTTELPVASSEDSGRLAKVFQKEAPLNESQPEAAVSSVVAQDQEMLPTEAKELTYHNIYSLTDEEIASIKNDMRAETRKDLLDDMIHILTSILQIEEDEKGFEDVLKIMEEMLYLMIHRGDLKHAARILEALRGLETRRTPLAERRQRLLEETIDRAGSPEKIKDIRTVLNAGEVEDIEYFGRYIAQLSSNAVLPLVELLGSLHRIKPRRILCEAMIDLSRPVPQVLARCLGNSNWFTVRNLVYILGKIGNEQTVNDLAALVNHPEPKVRKELFKAFESLPGDQARQQLTHFLWDEDRSIRIQAVRNLARWNVENAVPLLLEVIESAGFGQKDFYEKKEIFDVLGRIGGPTILPYLRKVLKMPSWYKLSGRHKVEEMRLCAVLALKRMGTPEAEELLKEGAALRNKDVRQACLRVLEEMKRDGGELQ